MRRRGYEEEGDKIELSFHLMLLGKKKKKKKEKEKEKKKKEKEKKKKEKEKKKKSLEKFYLPSLSLFLLE